MTKPIRVLHVADIHIGMENYGKIDPSTGLNSRVMDFLHRLDDLVDYALSKDVDFFLFAGDAYRNQNPNPTYQREFAKRIKNLSNHDIPVLLLVGNHDLPGVVSRANTLDIFKTLAVPHVIVGNRAKVHRVHTKRGDLLVATVPYPVRSQLLRKEEYKGLAISEIDKLITDKMAKVIQGLANEAADRPDDLPAILTGHFSVSGAQQGSEQSVMIGRDVVVLKSVVADPTWDYVALGHIHKFQDLNEGHQPPVVYSGSLERIDFGEEREEKGFVLAEVQPGSTRYRFLPGYKRRARPFVTIRVDARDIDDPTAAVLTAAEGYDLHDAVVRIFVQMRPEQQPLLHEGKVFAALPETSNLVAINRVFPPPKVRLAGSVGESKDPMTLLDYYFRQQDLPEAKREQLMKHAQKLYEDVFGG